MAEFDPFKEGAAVEVLEPHNSGAGLAPAKGEFDPFAQSAAGSPPAEGKASAAAPERDSSLPTVGNSYGSPEERFAALYAGPIDTLDRRLTPEERGNFARLDAVSDNSPAARAQAINQAFYGPKLSGISHSTIERNWPAIRATIAKEAFGVDDPNLTDTRLFSLTGQKLAEAKAEKDTGEIKPWTWKSTLLYGEYGALAHQRALSSFWESINKPLVEIPDAPHDLPHIPALGHNDPAIVGAIFNGLKPLIEGIESPLGIASLGAGTALKEASATYPLAKAALAGMGGVFTGLMGYGTVQAEMARERVFRDPNATFDEKVTAGVSVVANAAATLTGVLGTALEVLPGKKATAVVNEMQGKTPGEAAQILRREAADSDVAGHSDFLDHAANELEKIESALPKKEAPDSALKSGVNVEQSGGEDTSRLRTSGRSIPTEAVPDLQKSRDEAVSKYAPDDERAAVESELQGVRSRISKSGETGAEALSKMWQSEIGNASPELQRAVERYLAVQDVSHERPRGTSRPPYEPETGVTSMKQAWIDAERESMGLPPAERAEVDNWEKSVARAEATVKTDSNAGRALIDELQRKNRTLNADEKALAVFELNRLKIEVEKGFRSVERAQALDNKDAIADAQVRQAQAMEDFDRASTVLEKSGSLSGQSLAAQKLIIKDDYSIAGIERRVARAKGEKLNPEELQRVHELATKLKAAEDELAKVRAERAAAQTPVVPGAPRARPPTRVSSYLSEQAKSARARIEQRLRSGRVSSGIDPSDIADYAIIGADYIARGVTEFAAWSKEMVREFGEAIKPVLKSVYDQATSQHDNAARLVAAKTRTAKSIADTEGKIGRMEAGDFSKPEKTPIQLDDELRRARVKLESLKREARRFEIEKEAEARSTGEKALAVGSGFVRGGILSTPSIIVKLGAFTISRPLLAPLETAAGYGWSKMFPETAAKAAGSGVVSLLTEEARGGLPEIPGAIRQEARALAATFTKGLREAARVLTLKDSTYSSLYDPVRRERRWYRPGDWIAALHEALHLPSRINEFKRQLQRRIAHAIRNDVDPRNEFVAAKLEKEAWEASGRAAFIQENRVAKAWTASLHSLEARGRESGVKSGLGMGAAAVLRAWEPITTVPVNIAREVLVEASPIGPVRAAATLAWNEIKSRSNNFEGMTDGQAEQVMRLLAKGTVGSAFLLMGWLNRDKLGGLYIRGEKRKPGDLKPDEMQIGDAAVPAILLHNPFMTEANVGASLGRMVMRPYKKTASDDYGVIGDIMAVSMGVAEQVPFAQLAGDLDRLKDPKQAESVLAAKTALFLVPGFVDWVARQTDKPVWFDPFTDPKQRKAVPRPFTKALGEELEKRVPGLRENVAESKAQQEKDQYERRRATRDVGFTLREK